MKVIKCQDGMLPFITCECGTQISLVRDLDEMSSKLKAHVATHRNAKLTEDLNEKECSRIENSLVMKVFRTISISDY